MINNKNYFLVDILYTFVYFSLLNIFFFLQILNFKVALYSLLIILIVILPSAYISLAERQIVGIIQQRFGPNLWGGIFSLINPILDGVKLFLRKGTYLKDNKNNKYVTFMFAYTLAISLSIWVLIYIKSNEYTICFILMILMINSYGIFLGGLTLQNKYVKLSILRLVAIIISYDLTIGLIFLFPASIAQTLSIYSIEQSQFFYGIILFINIPSFILYYILLLSESKKVPFDTIESEPEMASGYMQEMSSISFALLVISEYIWLFFLIVLCVKFFSISFNYVSILFFLIMFLILRTMLPNYRFDQIINLFWKYLFPLTLLLFIITFIYIYI